MNSRHDSTSDQAVTSSAGGAIYVHLCSGEHREVRAADVALRGDKLVCIDARGHEVARFPARDVYMCARNHLPGIPL